MKNSGKARIHALRTLDLQYMMYPSLNIKFVHRSAVVQSGHDTFAIEFMSQKFIHFSSANFKYETMFIKK